MNITNKIKSLYYYVFIYIVYKLQFKFLGKKVRIYKPLLIEGKENISIGSNTTIGRLSWIACLPITNSTCNLTIKANCRIGNFNHIYTTGEIIIENNVLTADKVYISDNLHDYKNPNIPILKQSIIQLKPLRIGEGSWLGENVCIIGASIGKNSVIGANSVVTKDIPDYCVAVGIPAKIIKKYCFHSNEWKKTNSKGDFLQ